jgi:hypothetical protein
MRVSVLTTCGALLTGFAMQALAASAVVVGPQTSDPILWLGTVHSPALFTITNDRQASIIYFHRAQGNAICNRIAFGVHAAPPIPLEVQWNGGGTVLMPGKCQRVDAFSARIAPAVPMGSDTLLRGM